MTDQLRQAAQQALEEMETNQYTVAELAPHKVVMKFNDAITALRTALAQPVQEPVAWAVQGCSKMWRGEFAEIDAKAEAKRIGGTCVAFALYTEPPQRPWQGLTEFQFAEIYNKWNDTNGSTPWGLNQALEAKLRKLNK
jgi:hypothetical protein